MATTALALLLGAAVGLALGALGGGGSVLAVPALVYLLGQSPHDATTASLVIVLASALAGLVSHARAGNVRLREGVVFGAAGLVGSVASAAVAGGLPGSVVLPGFAVVMGAAAVAMWRSASRSGAPTGVTDDATEGCATVVGERPAGPDDVPAIRPHHGLRWQPAAAGAGVGVLVGVFGVGGGFLAVPALVAVVGLGTSEAIGTSLLVIALNAAAALVTRLPGSELDWRVVLPFAATAAVGAVAGRHVAGRCRSATLQRAFAVLLVVLAAWVLVDQLLLAPTRAA